MTKPHPYGPPNNDWVRSSLFLIDNAIEQSNIEMLEHVAILAFPNEDAFEYEIELQTLIYGSIDIISQESDDYALYTKENIETARINLIKRAFGNFNEAMEALSKDLLSLPSPSGNYEPLSDIFKPELFDVDEEDMKMWSMMRDSVISYKDSAYDEELDEMLSDGAEMIREYQEKYYGPLIPVIVASYVKKTEGKKVEGYNVKLWYDYPTLRVDTNAPFYEELDNYFINKKPVKSFEDFSLDSLPSNLGEYTLDGAETSSLFEYELNR